MRANYTSYLNSCSNGQLLPSFIGHFPFLEIPLAWLLGHARIGSAYRMLKDTAIGLVQTRRQASNPAKVQSNTYSIPEYLQRQCLNLGSDIIPSCCCLKGPLPACGLRLVEHGFPHERRRDLFKSNSVCRESE